MTPTEVICSAASDAILDGLLMVFHIERSGGECPGQCTLPRRPSVVAPCNTLLCTL